MSFRTALITGASSGIGAGFARVLAAETNLVLTGRNEARLAGVAMELARPGRSIETIGADLSTREGRAATIAAGERAKIDLLVSNAGLGYAGKFVGGGIDGQRETLAVNVEATLELLHALLPDMITRAEAAKRRAGLIIVASGSAFGPSPGMAVYSATKGFQVRLAQSLAAELKARPIDVLAICPPYTDTDFFARSGAVSKPGAMKPDEVAREAFDVLGKQVVYGPTRSKLYRFFARHPALDPRPIVRVLLGR